jgi:glycosyltransferase involved in cell wall biosynthesis
MYRNRFSILITTKNRKDDLKYTISRVMGLTRSESLEWIICDDGSSDGTFEMIKSEFPMFTVIRNKTSRGLIYSRNLLMNLVTTEFAISVDDDLHIITEDGLGMLERYFDNNPAVGVVGFRIYWSKSEPLNCSTVEGPARMQSYNGGAHAFRMEAWKQTPGYPAWFIFYGEEDYISYHLFLLKWEIHYLPSVLVNHRVELRDRKNQTDYTIRLRRSLRAGWILYLLFYPVPLIPRKILSSVKAQFSNRILKGDLRALLALVLASFDLLRFLPKIVKNRKGLSKKDYNAYNHLPPTKIYWSPESL